MSGWAWTDTPPPPPRRVNPHMELAPRAERMVREPDQTDPFWNWAYQSQFEAAMLAASARLNAEFGHLRLSLDDQRRAAEGESDITTIAGWMERQRLALRDADRPVSGQLACWQFSRVPDTRQWAYVGVLPPARPDRLPSVPNARTIGLRSGPWVDTRTGLCQNPLCPDPTPYGVMHTGHEPPAVWLAAHPEYDGPRVLRTEHAFCNMSKGAFPDWLLPPRAAFA